MLVPLIVVGQLGGGCDGGCGVDGVGGGDGGDGGGHI